MNRALACLATLSLLGLACASSPHPPPAAAPSARVPDSAPERIAAQRAASGNLQLEQTDERWGIEAARERKAAAEAPKKPPPAPASAPAPAAAPAPVPAQP